MMHPKAPSVPGFKSRAEVAALFGLSKQSIYFFDKTGRLKSTVIGEHIYYSDADVAIFKSGYVPHPHPCKKGSKKKRVIEPTPEQAKLGPLAKAVFKCLRDEKDIVQTVIATGAHPSFVHEMWLEMRTSFQAREHKKRMEVEERLVVKLSNERVKRARIEHTQEMARIQRGG